MKTITFVISGLFALATVALADTSETSVRLFRAQQSMAEQGGAQAQFYLGEMYEQGLGTERDMNQAIIWYTRAANQGYPLAQRKLKELAHAETPKPPVAARPSKSERTAEPTPAPTAPDAARAKAAAEQAQKTGAEQARKAADAKAKEQAALAAKENAEAAARKLKQQQETEALRKARQEVEAAEKEKRRAAAKAAAARARQAAEKGRAY